MNNTDIFEITDLNNNKTYYGRKTLKTKSLPIGKIMELNNLYRCNKITFSEYISNFGITLLGTT